MALVRSKFEEELPSLKLRETGVTAIAINRDRNSQMAIKWAADNLLNKDSKCILIHVQSKTLHLEDYLAEPEDGCSLDEVQQLFLPYRAGCARKGIKAKEVVIQDADVPSALVDYIVNNCIVNIVVGASSRSVLARRFRNTDVASSLLKSAPESCAVYVISKGNLQNSRPSSRPQTPTDPALTPRIPQTPNGSVHTPGTPQTPASSANTPCQQNYPHFPRLLPDNSISEDMSRSSSGQGSLKSEILGRASSESDCFQHFDDKARSGYKTFSSVTSTDNHSSDDALNRDSRSDQSDLSGPISLPSTDRSETGEFSIESASSKSSNSPRTPHELEAEMRRLKLELKHSMELYNSVCKEAVLAKQMAKGLHQLHVLEARKLEEARLAEEAARSLAEMEKKKRKVAMEAVHMAQRLAEMETQKRKDAEMRAKMEAEQMRKETALAQKDVWCRRYTIDKIEAATNYFHISNKIGEGGYGPVFKGMLGHIPVAIKVLRPEFSQGQRQFQQEVEVLSSMRHPHMVLLLGVCPEYGCLVYEYMDYGNLEDRLFRKDGTPPIPWKTRFKIASEIATALLFLHETTPEPVVHRDLKPANILLNRNYVSKIGDVGLARLVPQSAAANVSQYRLTAAAGTFCYIDPEYQHSGKLTVKSDLYSLGILLLQLVTAKPPMGLTFQVEEAINKGTFLDILDPALTDCPVEETLSLAKLALKCCELRKKDRPSLASEVLPELNRLRDLKLAGEPEAILPQTYHCKSNQQVQTLTSQISARSGWRHRMKSMTKLWSFRTNSGKVRALPPRGNQPSGRSSNAGKFTGCWSSFVSCSAMPNAPMQRLKSFS